MKQFLMKRCRSTLIGAVLVLVCFVTTGDAATTSLLDFSDGDGVPASTSGNVGSLNTNQYTEEGFAISSTLLNPISGTQTSPNFIFARVNSPNWVASVNSNDSTGLTTSNRLPAETIEFDLVSVTGRIFDLQTMDVSTFYADGVPILQSDFVVSFQGFLNNVLVASQDVMVSGRTMMGQVNTSNVVFGSDFDMVDRVVWEQGGSTRRHQFDNIQLESNAVAIPEPGSGFAILGLAAIGYCRWRRPA